MRNFTFLLLLASAFAQAQGIIFQEDFESYANTYSIPSTWTEIDNDGDGTDWYNLPNTYFSPVMSHLHGRFAASFSWANQPMDPDDILTTPLISIPENAGDATLTFYVGTGYDAARFQEHFAVYVTSKNDKETIINATPLLEETLPHSGNTQRTIALEQFKGQDIYISFRHFNSSNQWILAIDDIMVSSQTLSIEANTLPKISHFYNAANKTLKLQSNTVPFSSISVYNLLGKSVLQQNSHNTEEILNLSQLTPSIYLVKLYVGDDSSKTIKLLVH